MFLRDGGAVLPRMVLANRIAEWRSEIIQTEDYGLSQTLEGGEARFGCCVCGLAARASRP